MDESNPGSEEHIASFLSTVPGFDRLEAPALKRVARLAHLRSFDAGEFLMRKGDDGDCMHIILEGEVSIPIMDDLGRTRLTINLGEKDLIGEMALLTGAPRTADVIALGPLRTLVLPRPAVSHLLSSQPELARFLAEILGRRLGEQGGIEAVGKYKIVGTIGEGSNGKVYRAIHPALNRIVAIKMLAHDLVHQPGFRDRFLDEARMLATLSHDNIVEIYDTEEAYGTLFIIMEAVEGTNLERHLLQRGRLDAEETTRILLELASALAYAHQRGVAHRDIKPANAVIDPSGKVKLMDFGLARAIREDPEARNNTIDGTPKYLAPEIARGQEGDGRVDVYALGVMAFEMLCGRPPFESESIQGMLKAHVRTPPPDIGSLVSGLPKGLVDFVNGALVKDPARRLQGWKKIRCLLETTLAQDDPKDQTEERIVRVRCSREMAGEVDATLQRLCDRLASKQISVALARLREDSR